MESNGETPNSYYLEILANYLVVPKEKEEKRERQILTENRLSTINKRETSFEGLSTQFENGEDGVYNLVKENDKSVIFQPKDPITKEDIATIPELKQINDAIEMWKTKLTRATGKDAYIIKQAIIDLQKDQYIVRQAYRRSVNVAPSFGSRNYTKLEEKISVAADGTITTSGVSLLDPEVCAAILKYYSRLKQGSWNNFYSDTWYLMTAFDEIAQTALAKQPAYYESIVEWRIDGLTNEQIQIKLQEQYNVYHATDYISRLWTKKIPSLIAAEAQEQYLDYHYLEIEKVDYKKCSRCGQIIPKIERYFSRNKSSKDGYYSICKKCRSKKRS